MAKRVNALEAALENKYGDAPEPILTTIEQKEYSDEEFKKMVVYTWKNDILLNPEQLTAVGNGLVKRMAESANDPKIVPHVMLLALNLRRTDDLKKAAMDQLKWANKVNLDFSEEPFLIDIPGSSVKDIPQFEGRKTREELEAEAEATFVVPDTSDIPAAEVGDIVAASKKEHIENYVSAYNFTYMKEKRSFEKESTDQAEGSRSAVSPEFWPFLAAYLVKIFIKTPENVQLGIKNMKERFVGFYPGGTASETEITLASLQSLSSMIKPYKEFLQTWIGMTAQAEYELDSTSNTAGMIRYLANIQFGYNGMHGYGLFREVLLATKWKSGQTMTKLWMEPTGPALDTINTILRKHESVIQDGNSTKKPTFFKYARAVDPRYFLPLQPGQCLSLIYICCKILTHYTAYNEISNPLKMIALQKLGNEQREFLDVYVDTLLMDAATSSENKTKLEIKAAEIYRLRKEEKEEEEKTGSTVVSELRKKMEGRS